MFRARETTISPGPARPMSLAAVLRRVRTDLVRYDHIADVDNGAQYLTIGRLFGVIASTCSVSNAAEAAARMFSNSRSIPS